jgi:RNA polymerase sigma-70 factor (ECF subfamily)
MYWAMPPCPRGLIGPLSGWDEAPDTVGRFLEEDALVLSEIDRNLLERCLERKPRAWEDFVDRFMGLVVHVINHTAQARSLRLGLQDRDDLVSEVFLDLLKDDFAILRHFRGQSSLATYLTVVARRIVVKGLLHQKSPARLTEAGLNRSAADSHPDPNDRITDRDEVDRLLEGLHESEARVVRMYHLDGMSYRDISQAIGVPENSIGPLLSRARGKLRRAGVSPGSH